MTSLLTPENHVWFTKKGRGGVRSLDGFRKAHQLTIKAIGDSSDRRAKACLISFNVEGYAYVIEDATQLRAVIEKLDTVYRQMTGSGEAKVISFGSDKGADDYLYNTTALGPVSKPRSGPRA